MGEIDLYRPGPIGFGSGFNRTGACCPPPVAPYNAMTAVMTSRPVSIRMISIG
jgi:hypothetical protein